MLLPICDICPGSLILCEVPDVPRWRGYSLVVAGRGRLVVVSGQVAQDERGELVGAADPAAQARQVFEDLRRCLALAGARFEDVVKLTFFVPDVADLAAVRAARDAVIDQATMPSARSKTEDSAAAPASGRTDGGAMPLPGSGTMVRAG